MQPLPGRGTPRLVPYWRNAVHRLRYLLAVSCLVFAAPALPVEDWEHLRTISTIKVLLPGEHHGDEVPYPSGPGWLALVISGTKTKLEPVTLKVGTVYDAVLDAEQGPHSGKNVAFTPKHDATVLLKGKPLHPGEVPMALLVGENAGITPKQFTLGERRYTLQVGKRCDKLDQPCPWVLSDGATRQTLHEFDIVHAEDGQWDTDSSNTGVVWAGDLDGDGKLDLILDVSNHYNAAAQIRVFLSSQAKKGQLVGIAGWFAAVGC